MIGAIIARRKACSKLDALSRHDLDDFIADWAEDASFVYSSHSSDVSGEIEIEGKESIREWFQRLMELFPLTSFTAKNIFVRNIFAFGSTNTMATEWDAKVQTQGGKESETSGITVVHVKKGKVVLMREYAANPLMSVHRAVEDSFR